MVGCWNLELKMIPNDRARLGLGPRGVFGLKILIFGGHGVHGPPVHRGILAFFRMWPHTNGWAPNWKTLEMANSVQRFALTWMFMFLGSDTGLK